MILEIRPLPAAEITPADSTAISPSPGSRPQTSTASIDRSSYSQVSKTVEQTSGKPPVVHSKPTPAAKSASLWEKESFGFADFLDIINPLQHIPIVATIYRNLSGDQIAMAPRVIGGALWGRIGGFVSGIINSAVEWFTGKDVGDHIYSAIIDKLSGSSDSTAVAQASEPRPADTTATVGAAPPVPELPSPQENPAREIQRSDAPASTLEPEPLPLSDISAATPCILAAPIVQYRSFAKLDDDDNAAQQRKFHLSA
jgi:hypothetical protein